MVENEKPLKDMSGEGTGFKAGVDRRQFLQMSLVASAASMAARSSFGMVGDAIDGGSQPRSYAAMEELPPGEVRPEGWLRVYLGKQAAELGSQLPEVSWPFTEAYWAGLEQGESWWPWEQKAYWVDGATRLALVMEDEALMKKVGATLDYTLGHAEPDGYLGPKFFEDPKGDEHRWPQNVFFRGLMADADAKGDGGRSIVEAVRKHYLNDKADYAEPERNVTNLEAILWCYGETGDKQLLALAEEAWARYLKTEAGKPDGGDLSELRVYAATPIDAHGVTYAETAKLPAILYMHTGKAKYLRFAQAAQRRIFDHHMLIDGVPSTSEWFRGVTSLDSHETCDIADHTWTWGYMMQATGDGVWGDRIERACFNAGPGAIKNDWKALQYFSCPNQVLATLDSDHNVMEHGGHMMAYQPNPGKRTACCGGNVHRVFPNYVSRMWMRSAEGGLVATLYGPSTVKTTVGRERVPVEIRQETHYPFEGGITLRFAGQKAVRFPLSLRVPEWCAAPRIAVNGKTVEVAARKGFVTVERMFQPGDTVELEFPMKLAKSHWPQGGVGIERGPLVYSLAIKEAWTPVVEPKYSTEAFPSLNAMPASEWNYGLVLGDGDLESQVKVAKGEMTDDPWSHPPVTLTVGAKKIAGYVLQENPEKRGQMFTPPLPDLRVNPASGGMEEIELVPYGGTQLRVTVFPLVSHAEKA